MVNDKTKLVKEAKNDKASRCCWSAYQKKLGKMGLGEMLPNPRTSCVLASCMLADSTCMHLDLLQIHSKT